MKISKSVIISSCLIFLSLIMLFLLRSVPVTKIWSSYSVLYVDKSFSEENVLSILNKNGCSEVISLGQQRVPFYSSFLPADFSTSKTGSNYLTERLRYFYDESNSFMLYYIPNRFEANLSKSLNELSKDYDVLCGIDGKQKFFFIIPIISLLFASLLFYFSENKKIFLLTSIWFIFLTVSLPFFPVLASCILMILFCFLFQKMWSRRSVIKALLKNVCFIVIFIVSGFVFIVFSWRSFILGLLMELCAVSSLHLYSEFEKYKNKKLSFTFEPIFSASQICVVTKRNYKFFLYAAATIFASFLIFIFSFRFAASSNVSSISMPVPSHNAQKSNLVNLEDFIVWAWNVQTLPYRNLNTLTNENQKPENGESVFIERYSNSFGSAISSTSENVLTFDEAFKNSVEHQIDQLPYPALEKLLKKQGKNIYVSYSRQRGMNIGSKAFSFILMFISLLAPTSLYTYYIIRKGKYENCK